MKKGQMSWTCSLLLIFQEIMQYLFLIVLHHPVAKSTSSHARNQSWTIFAWFASTQKWKHQLTKTVFPLYSSKIEERPTSFPAPSGVSLSKSFSSATGTSSSAFRFTPAIVGTVKGPATRIRARNGHTTLVGCSKRGVPSIGIVSQQPLCCCPSDNMFVCTSWVHPWMELSFSIKRCFLNLWIG